MHDAIRRWLQGLLIAFWVFLVFFTTPVWWLPPEYTSSGIGLVLSNIATGFLWAVAAFNLMICLFLLREWWRRRTDNRRM